MKQCTQKKCELLNTPSCPQCTECQSPSNVVSDYCIECYLCENEAGHIRGSRIKKEELDLTIAIKEGE